MSKAEERANERYPLMQDGDIRNKENLAKGTKDDILLIDFIDIR